MGCRYDPESMNKSLRSTTDRLYRGALDQFERLQEGFGHVRNQAIGTLTIAALLILVYQVELLLADRLGYVSAKAMFADLPVIWKTALTAVLGPFLHQGASHIFGNVGVLLLAGSYIEYAYGRSLLYQFYLVAGYFAAWFPLVFGSVGAVGASGVTYGLTAWMMVHAAFRILRFLSDLNSDQNSILDRRFGEFIPLGFGAGGVVSAVTVITSGTVSDAGNVAHFAGVLIGIVWGTLQAGKYVMEIDPLEVVSKEVQK